MLLGLQPISELHLQYQATEHLGRQFNLLCPCSLAFSEHEHRLLPPVKVAPVLLGDLERAVASSSIHLRAERRCLPSAHNQRPPVGRNPIVLSAFCSTTFTASSQTNNMCFQPSAHMTVEFIFSISFLFPSEHDTEPNHLKT